MEITIKRYSRKMTYEDAATLDEFWELVKRTERSLDREQRRHWDGRECDEYIIAAQGGFALLRHPGGTGLPAGNAG